MWQGQRVEMDLLLELEEELSWEWGRGWSEIKRDYDRREVEYMEGGGWDCGGIGTSTLLETEELATITPEELMTFADGHASAAAAATARSMARDCVAAAEDDNVFDAVFPPTASPLELLSPSVSNKAHRVLPSTQYLGDE